MKRLLAFVGAIALLAWTGIGLVAWMTVAQRVNVTFLEADTPAPEAAQISALADELAALHQDVRALATAMGENLQSLRDELTTSDEQRASALGRQIAELRAEIAHLGEVARLAETRPTQLAVAPAVETVAAPHVLEPGVEAAQQLGAPAASMPTAEPAVSESSPGTAPLVAKPRKSFLAFKLPSDDFRFDERRHWTVLPALSRVGFDAKSTLHDFSGISSNLSGELEADLSRPADHPRASVHVQATTLATGNDDRDANMRENLVVGEHPELAFEIESFEPDSAAAVDSAARKVSGRALGKMTIRGVTRELAMPVKLSLDDARRLCIEGEARLDITEFGVPVPDKLGLIKMDKDVRVWISLRLRVDPRSGG